jgi:alpha-tubulin suppressor-like RCC1 family protein
VTDIAAGTEFAVAVQQNGTVMAWGSKNSKQQLGYVGTASLIPVIVNGISNVKNISLGSDFVLALRNDNTVWTWEGVMVSQLK